MKKIAILGSCVTRDAFERQTTPTFDVKGAYFPRSSIISLTSNEIEFNHEDLSNENQWLKWVIIGDFKKNIISNIKKLNPDIICIDLIEERLNIAKYQNSFITMSDELRRVHLNFDSLSSLDVLKFTDPERFELFYHACSKFAHLINENFPNTPIVINKALCSNFILKDGDISACEPSRLQTNLDLNNILNIGYDKLSEELKNSISISAPEQLLIADDKHIWGAAPYHYVNGYYLNFLEKLNNVI